MNQEIHIEAADLAALFDDELGRAEMGRIKRHIADCPSCAAVVEDMALARQAAHELRGVPTVDNMWPCIEAALDREEVVVRKVPIRRWAAAASVALLVGIATIFGWREISRDDDVSRLPVVASEAPIDFGLYLASLDHVGETPALPPGYVLQSTSTEEALNTIGITDGLNLEELPADLSFRGAALISHGSSTIVQLTFVHDGEILVVLCQRDGLPVSFGQFPVTTTIVGKRKCLSAYCGTYRALCLTTEKGTFIVLGPTKNPRLNALFETVTAA